MLGFKFLSVFLAFSLLAGCASTPTPAKEFGQSFYEQKPQKVGIYVNYPKKVTTYHPGANCLLCMAAAAAANTSVTSHMETLSPDDFAEVSDIIATKLREKGMTPVVINDDELFKKMKKVKSKDPSIAKLDHRPIKQKHDVDALVVVNISALGSERTYSAYVPTGAPQGYVDGLAYAIDLDTNAYEMYQPLTERVAVKGEWKEGPSYPGLTNAYYQAVEKVKDRIKGLFN